jgi:iron(III) transport system ATP-binding protein
MQIRFENVTQRYEGTPLFQGLNLGIPSGKFFTLLGPSGCGKTTLLRMLAGFVMPESGRVWFGERDVTALPAHRRGVGMVFQDYALFPDRSALANVMYGLEARGVSLPLARDRARHMLDRVGLGAFADRSPATLSGGQRQRVAMARALVVNPQLLLLDEPLAALDVKLRVELRALVRELQLESGITTVFVTHDQEEALALSDIVAVMDRGRIVQLGSPAEIYARPATDYAADFLGSANLLAVEEELASSDPQRMRFRVPGGVISLVAPGAASAAMARGLMPSGKPLIAVRREEIEIEIGSPTIALPGAGGDASAAHRDAGDDNLLRGQIEGVEFRGSVTGYRVRTAAGLIHVDVWSVQHGKGYKRGEAVVLRIPPTALLVEASR